MDLLEVFRENRELIKERFGIKKIGVFGSSVRREEKEESDVDVLVEFGEGKKTLWQLYGVGFLSWRVV